MKTYQIRIFPTKVQEQELLNLSQIRNDIWNTFSDLQQQRIESGLNILTNFDLHKLITTTKLTNNWGVLNSKASQRVATELFKSYQSYFVLRKKDKTAKAPSKITNTNFHTLVYNQSGWVFKKEIIVINKLPFEYKTNIVDIEKKNIKEIRIKFKNNKWLVDVVIEEAKNFNSSITIQNKVLALDLGLKHLATGIDTNGKVITIPNRAKKIGRYFINKIKTLKSKQSKCTKYSKRYTTLNKVKSKLYSKKNAQIKQTLHIQSKKLVNMNYKTIVVGDLQIKKLMQLEKNKKSKVSRSFGLSNIAMFVNMLTYKSVVLNQSVEKIDESNTTQLNCLTGKLFDNKVTLSDREVKLSDTIIIDRDLNSAINILNRWQNKQLAPLIEPLDLSNVLNKFNLFIQESHSLQG